MADNRVMSKRSFQLSRFGLDPLELVEREETPPGPGELLVEISAFSLNYRDLSTRALGANVVITSSSDEKLERAASLGADVRIYYKETPRWDKEVVLATEGAGADVVVETAGAATLGQSLKAAKAGGIIGLVGSLGGLSAEINLAPAIMKRLRVIGVLVDSRTAFEELLAFLARNPIEPVVDRVFAFEELEGAFRYMDEGRHFGKIVVRV
jgi:NADPH:quinone reductase-like Zn-dependent oxidoreductase